MLYGNRYELEDEVASGATSRVYVARDTRDDRRVAVKVMKDGIEDQTVRIRFEREAKNAGRLSGEPNLVDIYDWGFEGARPYIVMEFVKGKSLKQLLSEKGPPPPQRAAEIMIAVARALEAAHNHGIIHRDVKPANILIDKSGDVKVADFGFAKSDQDTDDLTETGFVMGTVAYVAPERLKGRRADPRSDVYALGVILYELLTGQLPFVSDNIPSVAYMQVHKQPKKPTRRVHSIPKEIELIDLKALSKNPVDRYQSAGEFKADLHRFLDGRKVLANPKKSKI